MKFTELGLPPEILQQLEKQGISDTTPIQERCIPEIQKGKDVVGQSETGSGKTIAFALPILEKIQRGNGIQALILTPTRELCSQVKDSFVTYSRGSGCFVTSVYGGVGINPQISAVQKADIVVATPGRLCDHIQRGSIHFQHLKFLVLDEVDKMFEMGFIDDVEEIIRHLPRERQTLLFSATISEGIRELIQRHQHHPVFIRTQTLVDKSLLHQVYYQVQDYEKFSLFVYLLKQKSSGFSLVFCAMRHHADALAYNLQRQGVNALVIHGGLSQNRREYALDSLKKQHIKVLVATDVAARGLDIKNVTHVYNYDVPKTAEDYVHRIGRTARAGKNGEAITLLTNRDHDNFRRVLMNRELHIVKTDLPVFEKIPYISNKRGGRMGAGRSGVGQQRGGFQQRGFHRGGQRDSRGGYHNRGEPRGRGFRDEREGRREHRDSGSGFERKTYNM